MSRRNETAVFIEEAQKREILRGIFDNYYHAIHTNKLVFDTNRAWCSKLPTLVQLFPEAKVICCVRHVGWIMDSIERIIRANPFELSGIFGFEASNTVFTRVGRLATSEGMVGFSLDALREAFFGEHANRLILIDYEALTKRPKDTLRQLYAFVGEEPYGHDFENVQYSASEFDIMLGTPNLHTVRRKVEWLERRSLLPPDLFRRFDGDAFWRNSELNSAKVPVIL